MTDEIDLSKTKKELKNYINNDRYKKFGNYTIDKIIVQIAFWSLLAIFFLIVRHYNYDLDYMECKGLEPCKNYFYEPVSWKNQEYVYPGTYGNNVLWIKEASWQIPLGILILAAGLNHIIHNRKKTK